MGFVALADGTRIVSNAVRVFHYVNSKMPFHLSEGLKGLGLEKDGELVAGVLYEGYNGHNVWMHVAAEDDGHWLNRAFLRACFEYPFVQLGLKRVSGLVAASNVQARRFDEHLGFQVEGVLKGAAHDGSDAIAYVMWRDQCRFIPPQEKA